jgi:rod shape-determining protein MreC
VLLRRYRDLSVLVIVLALQLLLLAYQVRSRDDVPLIRVWAVGSVMPIARAIDAVRGSTIGALSEYFVLLDVKNENRQLKSELGRLKMENQYLRAEISTADRARTLAAFQSRNPSRTIAARLVGSGIGANSRMVFVDRGTNSGVAKGMAVVTPDGIVGKVTAAYGSVSQVVLVTDPGFAAGVISQRRRVPGTLKGQGHGTCLVDYIQNEDQVEAGEWFYTSGDDRIFPKGLPVGQVKVSRNGRLFKEIAVVPSGLQNGIEEVLILLDGIHQEIPEGPGPNQQLQLLPPPPPDPAADPGDALAPGRGPATDADQVVDRYRRIGAAQGHIYGEGGAPNFNVAPAPAAAAPQTQAPAPAPPGQQARP